MHKKQDKPDFGKMVTAFFDWAYQNGDKLALDLDYVPMPDKVKNQIRADWKRLGLN
jgi:phosphate transport system substrate-binding protein